jgi:hypothetical protein
VPVFSIELAFYGSLLALSLVGQWLVDRVKRELRQRRQ